MKDFNEKWSQLILLIKELKSEIQQNAIPASEKILDDVALMERFHVSKRTIATWREKRLIKCSKFEGKYFYKLSDILDALEKNAIQPVYKSLKVKK